ncbi:MAG: hypothetical protein IPN11_14540 [Opitutaceae bacterium]|nr:hypothetical protein [Opitutaceae bacterium]
MLRRALIGAATTYANVNASATTIPFSARSIKRGSLVIALGKYDGLDTTVTASDNAGGKWKVFKRTGPTYEATHIIAYTWNHPGGSSVSVTLTLGASRGYRSGVLIELNGPDLADPFWDFELAQGTNSAAMGFIQAPPNSLSICVASTYNATAAWTVSSGVSTLLQTDFAAFGIQQMPGGTTKHGAYIENANTYATAFILAASFRGPHQPRPVRRVIDSAAAAGYTHPTLSAATATEITSTTARGRVTATA